MKKFIAFLLMAAVAAAAVGCGKNQEATSAEATQTVTITSRNANNEAIALEVPYDPKRVAVLDMAALDIIDTLGMGDRVVGSASTKMDYLQSYMNEETIANIGTIKEPDMEAVMAVEPDIIFIGGRLSSVYDELSQIAPVVYLAIDREKGTYESTKENAMTIASIFGKEAELEEKFTDFDQRIETLRTFAEGKTAIVGLTTSGSFNLLGNDGRCSLIGQEIGFDNIGDGLNQEDGKDTSGTSTHGNEASFELVVQLNPDYMFVLDRDSATGAEGAQLAQEIVENELVKGTDTYKNGNVIYLEHAAVWYTAEGGISALDYMLGDLESSLL